MALSADIAALIELYGEDAIKNAMKVKHVVNRYEKLIAALKTVIDDHPKVSLRVMKRLLKDVYGEDTREKRKMSAYNEFFKSEMPNVKKEMPNADHKACVKEIAARWQKKMHAAESTFPASEESSEVTESQQPVKSKYKRAPKRAVPEPKEDAPAKRTTRARKGV